jgi:hypothetical protein
MYIEETTSFIIDMALYSIEWALRKMIANGETLVTLREYNLNAYKAQELCQILYNRYYILNGDLAYICGVGEGALSIWRRSPNPALGNTWKLFAITIDRIVRGSIYGEDVSDLPAETPDYSDSCCTIL